MLLFDLREPVNACSHGAGMLLALPVTWVLWKRCTEPNGLHAECCPATYRYQLGKALCLVVFGVSLILCYGISALFHATPPSGRLLTPLQRLDHVGIYVLIAGTYTPIAWSLLRVTWRWRTLTAVWAVALICGTRVWWAGVMPMWVSTPTYLAMGWAALFFYAHLANTYTHRALFPLPLGGVFYSIGAALNLARWPVIFPGFFAAHELFHFFVIAGSTCHIIFMLSVVIPSREPSAPPRSLHASQPRPTLRPERGSLTAPHLLRRLRVNALVDRQRSMS
jgi:hemolysin III